MNCILLQTGQAHELKNWLSASWLQFSHRFCLFPTEMPQNSFLHNLLASRFLAETRVHVGYDWVSMITDRIRYLLLTSLSQKNSVIRTPEMSVSANNVFSARVLHSVSVDQCWTVSCHDNSVEQERNVRPQLCWHCWRWSDCLYTSCWFVFCITSFQNPMAKGAGCEKQVLNDRTISNRGIEAEGGSSRDTVNILTNVCNCCGRRWWGETSSWALIL